MARRPPACSASPSWSYQSIAIVISAVHTGHQRVMSDCFVAPLVGILQPGLEEVQACSKACQHQDWHQQVEGDEPVQEQPRHNCCQSEGMGRVEEERVGKKWIRQGGKTCQRRRWGEILGKGGWAELLCYLNPCKHSLSTGRGIMHDKLQHLGVPLSYASCSHKCSMKHTNHYTTSFQQAVCCLSPPLSDWDPWFLIWEHTQVCGTLKIVLGSK